MVEKITVSPQEVRGYGNVVDEKELDDYLNFRCDSYKGTYEGHDVIKGVEELVFAMEPFISSLDLSGANVAYGNHVPLSSRLVRVGEDYGYCIAGKTIVLMEGEDVIGSEVSHANVLADTGDTVFHNIFLPVGDHRLHAVFEGDDEYPPAASETITVNVRKASYDIQWETDREFYHLGDIIVITGSVGTIVEEPNGDGEYTEVRQLARDTLIKLSPNGVNLSCTTDENGEFMFETEATAPNSNGILNLLLYVAATDTHQSTGQNIYIPVNVPTDLQSYLLGTSNYGYAQGSASRLSIVNSNELRGSASLICMNNDTFTDSNHYILTFDWKMSRGYEGGFVMGDENDYWAFSQQTSTAPIQHGSGSNDSGGGDSYQVIQSSQRFTDYVPVVIERDGNDWTVDVDNGALRYSFNANHRNRFGIRVWSGYCYVRNLTLKRLSGKIFQDNGVTGDVNEDYADLNGTINTSVTSSGTRISCSTYADCYRKANAYIGGDFQVEYTLVSTTSNAGGFALLDDSNNSLLYVEFSTTSRINFYVGNDGYMYVSVSFPCTMRFERVGSTLSLYIDDELISSKSLSAVDCFFAWKTHSQGGRNHIFKDLLISEL